MQDLCAYVLNDIVLSEVLCCTNLQPSVPGVVLETINDVLFDITDPPSAVRPVSKTTSNGGVVSAFSKDRTAESGHGGRRDSRGKSGSGIVLQETQEFVLHLEVISFYEFLFFLLYSIFFHICSVF